MRVHSLLAGALPLLGLLVGVPGRAAEVPGVPGSSDRPEGQGGAPGDAILEVRILSATGDPVDEARIRVVEWDRTWRADEWGRVRIALPRPLPDSLTLQVACPHHGGRERVWTPQMEGPLRVVLDPRGEAGAACEVVVEAERIVSSPTHHVLEPEEVAFAPGTHGDALKLLESLPGVAVTREFAPRQGALAMRGSGPGDGRVFVDGIRVPYLYHFREYASVLQNTVLDELVVHPSAYGSRYGDAVGGVVDVSTLGDLPEDLHAGANLNMIMGSGWLRAPAGGENGVSLAARRSYMDWLVGSSGQYTVWPVFWDSSFRFDAAADPDHRTAFTVLAAGDSYERLVEDPEDLDPVAQEEAARFTYQRRYVTLGLHRHDASSTLVSDGHLAWQFHTRVGDVGSEAHQDRTEQVVQAREEITLMLRPRATLALGADAYGERTDRRAELDRAWPELEGEAPLLVRGESVDERIHRLRAGAWTEARLDTGDWRWLPGLRVDGDTLTRSFVAGPRLGVRWARSHGEWRLGGGRYTQFASTDAASPETGDPRLAPTRSLQAAAGWKGTVGTSLQYRVDGWGKRIRDAVLEEAGEEPTGGIPGWAAGVELGMGLQLPAKLALRSYLSLGRSVREIDGESVPFDYDQRYAAGLLARWTPSPWWRLGLRVRHADGLPYTPIEDGVYDAATDTYLPVTGTRNSARLPPYTKIDLKVERRFEGRTWSAAVYVEVWYIPESGNVLYPAYRYDYDEQVFVSGPGFLPVLGVRGRYR